MAINSISTNHGQIQRIGYNAAVDSFCLKAGGQKVASGKFLSLATRVWLNYGGNPETTGINGYVYFEIHNKRAAEHSVDGTYIRGTWTSG